MIRLVVLFFITLFVTACASHRASYIPQDRANSLSSIKKNEYCVRKGDSLWAISKQYGVSVQELMQVNKIYSAKKLKEGQIIFIPDYSNNRYNFNYSKGYSKGEDDRFFSWPIKGEIINFFGEKMNNIINRGVNFEANGNILVSASAAGEVVYCDYLKGWGQTLILKHRDNFYTIYANLAKNSFREGMCVKDGEIIGEIASGIGGSRILHFELRKQHLALNPLEYLK